MAFRGQKCGDVTACNACVRRVEPTPSELEDVCSQHQVTKTRVFHTLAPTQREPCPSSAHKTARRSQLLKVLSMGRTKQAKGQAQKSGSLDMLQPMVDKHQSSDRGRHTTRQHANPSCTSAHHCLLRVRERRGSSTMTHASINRACMAQVKRQ